MLIDLLAQSAALFCPNALRLHNQYIHSFRLWKPFAEYLHEIVC